MVPGFVDTHVHGGGGASFDGGDPEAGATAVRAHLAHGTTTMVASLVTERPERAGRVGAAAGRPGRRRAARRHPPRGPVAQPAVRRRPRPGPADLPDAAGRGRAARGGPRPRPDGHARPGAGRRPRRGPAADRRRRRRRDRPHRRDVRRGARRPRRRRRRSAPTCSTRCAGCTTASPARSPRCSSTPTRTSSWSPTASTCTRPCSGWRPGRSRTAPCWSPTRWRRRPRPTATTGSGRSTVEVRDGVARLAGSGAIAGSTLTMAAAVRYAVQVAGLPLEDVVRAATAAPARLLGLDRVGALEPGFRADLVVLDDAPRRAASPPRRPLGLTCHFRLWKTRRPVTSGCGEPADLSLPAVENPVTCHLRLPGAQQELTGRRDIHNRN